MGKFFVQVGRVCRINYGPDLGKYVTIVDIVDANRVRTRIRRPLPV